MLAVAESRLYFFSKTEQISLWVNTNTLPKLDTRPTRP